MFALSCWSIVFKPHIYHPLPYYLNLYTQKCLQCIAVELRFHDNCVIVYPQKSVVLSHQMSKHHKKWPSLCSGEVTVWCNVEGNWNN